MDRAEFDRRLKESPELRAALNAFWPTIARWKESGLKGSPLSYSDAFIAGWDARAAIGRPDIAKRSDASNPR